MRTGLATALFLTLSACGGGNGESETPSPVESTDTSGSEEPHLHPPFEYEEVVATLDEIETPMLREWEVEVRGVVLRTYDDDGSGELDRDGEVDDVPCEVWRAINDGYRDRAVGEESIRGGYGFAPDTLYIDALGVNRNQRERLRVQLVDCGVR